MSTSTHDDTAGVSLAMTWELDADYITFARFMRAVVDRGLEHDSSTSWATERMSLEGLFHLALCTHRERGERAALLDLHSVIGSDCLAHLRLARGRAYVTAAARSVDALAAARTWLRERFPDSKPHEKKEVQMSFWTNDRGGWRMSRSIAVPAWSEITGNYPQDVGTQIGSLADRQFDDVHSGRLILWHGVPGTGKTHALRALAWEWREWCSFHYITDPESFFGGTPRYMLNVLLEDDDDDDDPRWRLLILEDTGELLTLDARQKSGQGLSRLLNVVDGLIGQGLRVLVLVTTNEQFGSLHPAVTRPGRCVSEIEFGPFPPDEADAWLESQGRSGDGTARTLASLFGKDDDAASSRSERRPVGFTQ
jgi:hypothetical protein